MEAARGRLHEILVLEKCNGKAPSVTLSFLVTADVDLSKVDLHCMLRRHTTAAERVSVKAKLLPSLKRKGDGSTVLDVLVLGLDLTEVELQSAFFVCSLSCRTGG